MTPELKLIAVNVTFLGFAYFWAYPRLTELTALKIVWRDAVITAAALMVGALLFARAAISFSMVFFDTNWFVFQLVTFVIIETPLFLWFAWRHDLEF